MRLNRRPSRAGLVAGPPGQARQPLRTRTTKLATATAATALTVAMAACSSAGSGPSAAAAPAAQAGGAKVAAAQALLNKYLAVPSFKAPGPAFDAKSAKGKKVLMISLTDQVAYNVYIEQAIKSALQAAGVQAKGFTNDGSVSEWTHGMQTAVSDKDNAVALIGIDPGQIAPQITAAQNAGLKVVDGQYTDVNSPYPAPFTHMPSVSSQDVLDGELEGASAIVHRNGAAHVLAVESTDSPDSTTMVAGMRKIFAADCKACTLSVVNVPIAEWATQGQSIVQSALTAHPTTNFVIPTFDAMIPTFVAAAITAGGNSGSIEIATADGSPAVLKMLEQKNMVVTDVGVGYQWVGWMYADQLLRAMSGQPEAAQASEIPPVRVFTAANVASTGTPPTDTAGYGNGYQVSFPGLWKLGS
jgi:ribose transport system substrate-binding protein